MPNAEPDDGALLRIGEAARIAGLSVDTLRRYSASGRLTAIRTPSGQRRFRRADIQALNQPEPAKASA